MILALMILMWSVGGLATYRRTGYALEEWARSGHDAQSVCDSCICKNCGDNWGHHFAYPSLLRTGCSTKNFEFAPRMHMRTFFGFFPTMALWPVLVAFFLTIKTTSALGISHDKFFVPPPVIETKEEKKIRNDELLAKRIAKLEKEAGIS